MLKILCLIFIPIIQIPGIILRYLPFHKNLTADIRKKIFISYMVYLFVEYGILFFLFYLGTNLFSSYFLKKFLTRFSWVFLVINLYYIRKSFFKHITIAGFQAQFSVFIHSLVAIFLGTFYINLPSSKFLFFHMFGYLLLTFPVVIFLCLRINKSIFFNKINEFDYRWKQIWILAPLYLYTSTVTTFQSPWFLDYQQFFIRITNILVTVIMVSIIQSDFISMEKNMHIKNLNKLLLLQKESVLQQSNIILENEKKLRIIRHDVRHNYRILLLLLQEKQYEQAIQLIKTLDNNIQFFKSIFFCENVTLNSVLFLYSEKCKKTSITTNFSVDFTENMPFCSYDIAILLSNALENAFLACEKLPSEKKRYIKLYTRIINNKMTLLLKNSFDGEVEFDADGLPISHISGHGLGMQSILSITKKYCGTIHCYTNDNMFYTSILLTAPIAPPPENQLYS